MSKINQQEKLTRNVNSESKKAMKRPTSYDLQATNQTKINQFFKSSSKNAIDVDGLQGYEVHLHKTLRTHLLEMIGLLHLKTKNNPKKQIQLIESMKQHLVGRRFGEEDRDSSMILDSLRTFFSSNMRKLAIQ